MSLLWAGATKNVLILETSLKFKPLGFLCNACPQVLEAIRMILHANIYHTIHNQTKDQTKSLYNFLVWSIFANYL